MPAPISFVMRVHNEEATLRESIESLLALTMPIEIIVVLHRCTDASRSIALRCQRKAPARHAVVVQGYNVPISRAGLETFITPAESPHSLVSYYGFAFGLASYAWKFKWDGDFVATPQLVKWINSGSWQASMSTVVNVGARFPDGKITREPYMHNCLYGFRKQHFWEVPRFYGGPVTEEAPDDALILHATTELKAYWREPPWFTDDPSDEAAELRRRYALMVSRVGPEPVGCARSCSPEADAYLAACLAVDLASV